MTRRKSSRRDFLKGRPVADAVADAVTGAAGDSRPPGAGYMVRVTRRAMACEFEVRFVAGRYPNGTEVALEALDLVEGLEEQMSVFRPTSDICHVNRTAAERPVEVEPQLFELLELGMRLHEQTDGAFDLTAGPLWDVWGFARRAGAVPSENDLAEARRCVGSHLVELDASLKTVRFAEQGVQLNLGSVGKGLALDRCCQALLGGGMDAFLIHGGQSSVLARGLETCGENAREQASRPGWEVNVVHPLRPDRRLAKISLCDRALATSGSRSQSFVCEGRRYAHILDPRTGRPAEGVLSATVVAPSAVLADALSTAFFVMGPEASLEFCRSRPELAAVLVCPIRHSGGIEICSAGLAEGEISDL